MASAHLDATVTGIGLVAGIGFTVSLFITDLAFTDPAVVDDARVSIVAASAVAAVAGTIALWCAPRRDPSTEDRAELAQ